MTNSSSNSANCATERLDCCCSKTPFASLSPSSSQQPQPQQSQYVADIVLSLVKDGRYHTTLVGIIIDAIEPWINPRVSNGLFTVMRPEIELLASFIHWIVVQWRMGRSLGMEYVGLTYGRNANMRRIDKSGILPAVSAGYESCPTIEKQEKSGIHSPAEMPSLPLLLGVSRTRATTYVLLHTLLPYLVRRAMRGGWEELSFIGKCFNRTGAVCNVESLRGEARLRVHEERRNRMISRSSSSMVMTSNGTSFDNQGVDHAGYDNQLVMNSLFPRRCYRQIMHRYVRGLWNILQKTAPSLDGGRLVGQERIVVRSDNGGNTSTIATERREHQSFNPSQSIMINVVRWILRLHVALFYFNGQYPFVIDRLFRIQYQKKSTTHLTESKRRPYYNVLGFLVLLDATSGLLHLSSRVFVSFTYFANRLALVLRKRTRQMIKECSKDGRRTKVTASPLLLLLKMINVFHITNNDGEGESMVDREIVSNLESQVPSILSSEYQKQSSVLKESQSNQHFITIGNDENSRDISQGVKDDNTRPTRRSCGICLTREMAHPAAAPCGHVFCWDCVIHWTTNVRLECPACRSSLMPQNILALYQY